MIYIFDIDGTLADISHRLHFIQTAPANWDKFFAACVDDAPINEVIATAQLLKRSGAYILLLSGRSEVVRIETIQWLARHFVPWNCIYMRAQGDHRQDNIVKEELLNQALSDWHSVGTIIGVFEDRKQVVDMYRQRGLRVFQVAEGDF